MKEIHYVFRFMSTVRVFASMVTRSCKSVTAIILQFFVILFCTSADGNSDMM